MHLRALSVDKEIKDSLAGGKIAGSTLAVYDRAVYLKAAGGAIVVISRPGIGNGPGFILLEHDDSLKSGHPSFFPDEPFEGAGGLVRVGGDRIVIELGVASEWDPCFSSRTVSCRDGLAACIELVREMVLARGRGFLLPDIGWADGSSGDSPRTWHSQMSKRVCDLRDALARGCEMGMRLAVRGLIGLGEGLTPSCDDLLVGLLGFMFGMRDDPAIGAYAGRVIASLVKELALVEGKTTPVAAHFLAAAARGRFTERVKNMLEAIFAADEKRMERAGKRLIEYGSTSGVDLMCGMVLGYEVINRIKD